MADEFGQEEGMAQGQGSQPDDTGQQGHGNEFGQQSQAEFAEGGQQSQADRQNSGQEGFSDQETTGNQGSFSGGGQSSGQPIGGNDSNTGTGTPLSQGFEPSQGSSDTMTADRQDETGSSQSGQSGEQGSGFMASEQSGSDDYLREDDPQTDFAERDSLNQQDDGGMGKGAEDQSV